MKLSVLWRTAALIAGFSVLGFSSAQAADWPRATPEAEGLSAGKLAEMEAADAAAATEAPEADPEERE